MSVRILLTASAFVAALALVPASAQQISGNARFCLKQTDGAMNCTFASMEQCEKGKQGNTNSCVENPKMTTGSGATKDNMKKN